LHPSSKGDQKVQ